MKARATYAPHWIFPAGAHVIALVEIRSAERKVMHPTGAVGVVVSTPTDGSHSYRVRFPDGFETSLKRGEIELAAVVEEGDILNSKITEQGENLFDRVIFRCVVGSQAFGLATDSSDIDRRGIYLPTADAHWSLYGVPEQIENEATQETYWELQKFLVLALKANPNVLEALFSPLVEKATPLAEELLSIRNVFLSKLVYQTYNGYVLSQFKKMESDLRNQGQVKWKHVMHLIRLLSAGVELLTTGHVRVDVGERRERLLAIRRGEVPFEELEADRLRLHQEFSAAFETTKLPDRPDYARVNAFLISARRRALSDSAH